MPIVQLDSLSANLAGHPVLDGIHFAIEEGARIGLVGPSGSGKSTLLDVLEGRLEPTEGQVMRRRGLTIGRLRQTPLERATAAGRRVLDVASERPPVLSAIDDELRDIETRLGDPEVQHDPDRLARTLARQERALERFERAGGSAHESRVQEMLARFGFEPDQHGQSLRELSGGQRRRLALAALAARAPDLLLLDEPDNHLDLEGRALLERFVDEFDGTVILVSHDRALLDAVTRETVELDGGQLSFYKGAYSEYRVERERRRAAQTHAHATQQKEIARIEAQVARFEEWAHRVVSKRHRNQARSRRRSLERMEERGEIVERVRMDRRPRMRFAQGRGSRIALEARELAAGFDDHPLCVDVDLTLRSGERVGLVGPNGSGKSVLLRTLCGRQAPLLGEARIGEGTRLGYFEQGHRGLAGLAEKTPLELVRDVRPMSEDAAARLLMSYLFRYERVHCAIGTLSGGERTRLELARLVLEAPSLLVLDEPTNDLDIPAVEALEEALAGFEGAMLLVTHDRYFLETTCDRILRLTPEGLRELE